MKPIHVSCPKCGGKGTVTLPVSGMETIAALLLHPGATPPEIWNILRKSKSNGFVVTAVNQRLGRLLKLGLVRRKPKRGHAEWSYFAVTRP